MKNATEILIGIALTLINLGRLNILTILNLPIHEPGVSLHLLCLLL